jgi:hypothetical protein
MKQTLSATLMLEEVSASMYNTERMLRDKLSVFWVKPTSHNKDGELSISMKQRKPKLREWTKTGDSISTDHSILDPDSL